MQIAILNIAILGLLVFLFGTLASARPDDRLRCWLAGWICVLFHFSIDLWIPASDVWQIVRKSVSVDLLAIAGIFFVVSTMVVTEGRRAGSRLGIALAACTLPCIDVAIASPQSHRLLAIMVVARLVCVVRLASRVRPNRRIMSAVVVFVCLAGGSWIWYGLTHGRSDLVICALLAEIYLVTALDFWNNNWAWTAGLNTMGAGLIAWSSVFPLSVLVRSLWPGFVLESEFWNVPKLCVSIGMILVVLEEDTRAAQAATQEYRLLFDANPNPLWIFDRSTSRFLDVNQAALDLHGYTRDEFLALNLSELLDPALTAQVAREVANPEPRRNRASRHRRKDGSLFPVDIAAYSIEYRGKPCRFVLGTDVTERETLAQQLAHQVQHDALTGLPNRLLFQERLAEAVQESVKAEEKLAVLCFDLTRLKSINDMYGLRIGDECVKRVAGMLGKQLRGLNDFVARTGGGEFAIVLGGIQNAATAEQVANHLREAFALPLLVQGYEFQLSFSVGVAVCPDDGANAMTLWRRAESAQRQSRSNGGKAVWFSPELNQAAEEQLELEAYMRAQLGKSSFRMVYQPLYSLEGVVEGMEALVRLDHPTYGTVSPAKFIPIAEQAGLIVPIGQWVLEEVCRQLQVWKLAGVRQVPVAVNASGMELMHVEFAGHVIETLRRAAIRPGLIHLEVTETAAMQDVSAIAEKMAALSAIGIHFSIDDFGTGYSTLSRLHELPISILKIDRSFVDQLCLRNGTFSIVQAVISMAHALGHRVVAEGVEQPGQLSCLRTLGCDLLQGYLLSRPVAPERIPALVAGNFTEKAGMRSQNQQMEPDWIV